MSTVIPSACPTGSKHATLPGMAASSETALVAWWWQVVGYQVGEQVLAGLLDRHREPHRHYHTAAHIEWVLRHVETLAGETPLLDPGAVLAAAFFHDAVYEPTAPAGANEAASAMLAARRLADLGWPQARTRRVADLIGATASHEATPGDAEMAVLLDADMAVLAADAAGYDAYMHGVRAEYGHLDDEAWRTGRSQLLRRFIARPAIFATAGGRRRWEARARANVTAELATLTDPSR
jgi:predicted metal-dependent HD superfamily phosphohydrolase